MDDIRELAWTGNLVGVRHLIERQGIDVNEKHAMNGTTPLHWAVKGGYTNIISYLISKGADPNGKDNKGISPIDLASASPNSVRVTLGLDEIPNQIAKEKRGMNEMVESQAFVPLPPNELPLPPLQNQSSSHNAISSSNQEIQGHSSSISAATQITPSNAPSASNAPLIHGHTVHLQQLQGEIPVSTGFVPYGTHPMFGASPSPSMPIDKTFFMQLGEAEEVIEVDWPVTTFRGLLTLIVEEFQLGAPSPSAFISKIIKLPNILVRNDKDVGRIKKGDTLKIVMGGKKE